MPSSAADRSMASKLKCGRLSVSRPIFMHARPHPRCGNETGNSSRRQMKNRNFSIYIKYLGQYTDAGIPSPLQSSAPSEWTIAVWAGRHIRAAFGSNGGGLRYGGGEMYEAAPSSSEQIGAAHEMELRLRWKEAVGFHDAIRQFCRASGRGGGLFTEDSPPW